MLAINDLVELFAVLRANGVTKFEVPGELSVSFGAPVSSPSDEVKPAQERKEVVIEPKLKAALDRLGSNYRDPRLFNFGDQA